MRLIASFGEVLPLLVVAFASAALIALLITPLVRRLAIRLDNVDLPDHRRVNKRPIPRGGGIAVATAFIVVAIGILVANERLALVTIPHTIGRPSCSASSSGAPWRRSSASSTTRSSSAPGGSCSARSRWPPSRSWPGSP